VNCAPPDPADGNRKQVKPVAFSTLLLTRADRIATVTFTLPATLNAITEARLTDLEAVLDDLEQDETVHALIVTGTGRGFCVGLDLDLLDRAFGDIAYFESVVRRLAGIIQRIEALPIPTIAAVNGYARAGGFELCLGMDFMLIADTAKIGDAHTDAGVVPACVTLRLRRRIGQQRAKEMILSACWLTGPEAVSYGLALQCVPAADLLASAIAFACRFTDKQVFTQGEGLSVSAGTALELQSFVAYMSTQHYGQEGYRAFREKRLPSWRNAG
jgi:enoyl-CoA hydratase/carnithine racemase